jgi:hypothetical protein
MIVIAFSSDNHWRFHTTIIIIAKYVRAISNFKLLIHETAIRDLNALKDDGMFYLTRTVNTSFTSCSNETCTMIQYLILIDSIIIIYNVYM